MQALQFPRGNIYQIICSEGNQALSVQGKDPKSFNKSRVVGTAPNANDIYQLFMIEKIGLGDDQFEIVNCASNFVWDEEGSEIRLKVGKQNKDQLYKLERSGGDNRFWFKTSSKGNEAVALEGILRVKQFDPNTQSQMFYIVPVNNSAPLNETCVLVNGGSGKAVDIPEGTHEPGERLIQYERNRRFNQRWRWVKASSGYLLQSVLTGHCIDIAEEKKESGAKVVQWNKTGGLNQQWRPVPVGQGAWKLESAHAPGMFLSIKDDNVNDGGKLQISDGNTSSQVWKIEGFVPK